MKKSGLSIIAIFLLTIFLSSTSYSQQYNPYDEDANWEIGDFELLNAIDDWAAGNLEDFPLLALIDYWASGCYHWDTLAEQYKSGCSLTDNGDGTVTDNVTGLMWQQEDDNITRNWESAITYCENLVVPPSTYSDWRLPNNKEIVSVVDYSRNDPSIDSDAFLNTNSLYYWSSTTYAANPAFAWHMYFGRGDLGSSIKTFGGSYVRCVRGGQGIVHSYNNNVDGTVTDNVTGLMWQQEDDNITRNWESAITYCENLVVPPSTYSDWRLPTIKELHSIVDYSQIPARDSTVFPFTNYSYYWSSTTYAANPAFAWSVTFYSGSGSYGGKTGSWHVRCVRGGQ